MDRVKSLIKTFSNHHVDTKDNVLIFSTPRSGSTWLMELVWSQNGFKTCNEPLNIRNRQVAEALGFSTWNELYSDSNRDIVINYLSSISRGRYGFTNPNPLRKYYRPFTNRIVFKIINGGEKWINEISIRTNARVLYLIRHPIPVSLSRKVLPRFSTLVSDGILNRFDSKLKNYAISIANNGDLLSHAVLSWCIQNKISLENRSPNWIVFTYEQLIMDPDPILRILSDTCGLNKRNNLIKGLRVPSAVTNQSQGSVEEILTNTQPEDLITGWKKKVSPTQITKLSDIVKRFNLDIYDLETSMPKHDFRV